MVRYREGASTPLPDTRRCGFLRRCGEQERSDSVSKKQNPVIWFEIPVKNMDRAQAFYEHVLGVKLEQHEVGELLMAWFPMRDKVVGACGALVKGKGYVPARSGTLVYFSTPDIKAALARAGKRGGRTAMPKTDIGEYGFIGLVLDCEGNRIGLHAST
jgi:uncharacterized protein